MSLQSPGTDLNFTNGFYESRSLQQSAQHCINYHPVIHERPTLSSESLYMTAGISEVLSGLDGVCRGFHTMNNIAYAVCGARLYSIIQTVNPDLSVSWSSNNLGEIAGSDRVIMSSGKTGNSYELVIVDPGNSTYHYDLAANTVSTLDGVTNFLSPAIDVANVFGYFVFIQEGTNKIFHSNLRDAETYNALDSFTVTQVENLKGLINFRDQLFVFADYKLIPFNYVGSLNGNTGFAFQSQFNAVKPYGLRNVYGKADLGSYLVFLGNRRNAEPGIFAYSGGEPKKISSEAVDKKIQALTDLELDKAFILTWSQGGHDFFSITVGDECFVYCLNTGRWHEQKSYIGSTQRRWRVNAITQAYNQLLVGDFQSGLIGILDLDINAEYGTEIHREIILQPYDAKGRFVQVKTLMLFADQGFSGVFELSTSENGVEFNTPLSAGSETGEYGKVCRWDRLGTFPFFGVIKIGTSDYGHINKLVAK